MAIHTEGDPSGVGATFTATTGYRPLALPDRMTVTRCAGIWTRRVSARSKQGPVLLGRAGFTVRPTDSGSEVLCLRTSRFATCPAFLPRSLDGLERSGSGWPCASCQNSSPPDASVGPPRHQGISTNLPTWRLSRNSCWAATISVRGNVCDMRPNRLDVPDEIREHVLVPCGAADETHIT